MKAMTISMVGIDASHAEKTLKEHGAEIFMSQSRKDERSNTQRVRISFFYPEDKQEYFDKVFNTQII